MFSFTKLTLMIVASAAFASAVPLANPNAGDIVEARADCAGSSADVTQMSVWEQCYKNCMKNVNVSDKWDTKEKKEKHCNSKCKGRDGEPSGLTYESESSDSDY